MKVALVGWMMRSTSKAFVPCGILVWRGAGGMVGAAQDCRQVIIFTGKQKQIMCSKESNPWMRTTKIAGMCALPKETTYAQQVHTALLSTC